MNELLFKIKKIKERHGLEGLYAPLFIFSNEVLRALRLES